MKSFDQKMQESQERIKKEQQKMKNWIAQENARRRKERNARLYATGAHVESIVGVPTENESIEDFKTRIGRLIRIGLAAEEVLHRDVDPMNFKFFLLNQEERGHYFTKFMDQREAGRDVTN